MKITTEEYLYPIHYLILCYSIKNPDINIERSYENCLIKYSRWLRGLGGWMVQDALVAAALHPGFHIGWGLSLSLRCMWVQIPPLYKIKCTYLIYYLIMSATSCAPWYNWNQLASKLKTVHISGSNQ